MGGGRNENMLVKGYIQIFRYKMNKFWGLMSNMMTIVNNTGF